MEFGIIAIGYNRPKSLHRLLKSLRDAEYFGNSIPLIISIDNSGNSEVYKIANEFSWPHGKKNVVVNTGPKYGLRNHILKCGAYTEFYENIAVFEDDIYVSPSYYSFAIKAITFYKDDENIAGISLYSHYWNFNCNNYFHHGDDPSDVYFMQIAQSWGQIWSRNKWNPFVEWYNKNKKNDFNDNNIPENIRNWPENSWLKYHIKYLINTNKYFVYPKFSLSTNFSDEGEHNYKENNDYQVPLQVSIRDDYSFKSIYSNSICYDAFFERIGLEKWLGVEKEDLCIDLYGMKKNNTNKKYWLTFEKKNYLIIKSFGFNLRPYENNIIFNNLGNHIFLYQTTILKENTKYYGNDDLDKTLYDIRAISPKILLLVSIAKIFKIFCSKLISITRHFSI